jgi:DNA primase
VLAGLIEFPAAIATHAEALARAHLADPSHARVLDVLLDAADSGGPVESENLRTTLAGKGLTPPAPADFAHIRYPFTRADAEPALAVAALGAAIAMLVDGPELEAAIAMATERFDIDEQTRLRARRDELESRLRAMIRG